MSLLAVGKSRELTSREKASFVVTRCKHTRNKNAGCLECIASAIAQYEIYAALKQYRADCAVVCERCETDNSATFVGSPRTSHRLFPKHRKPPYQNDWRDVPCKASVLHAVWDRLHK